jgi:hypothetical protein
MNYRFSRNVVTAKQRQAIDEAAQAVLDVRVKYPVSSIADLCSGRRISGRWRQPRAFRPGSASFGNRRTGAYFSFAPFIGAMIAIVLLHDPLSG